MSRTKKIVLIVLLVAGLCGAGYWLIQSKFKQLNALTEPMVMAMVDSGWDKQVIAKYASPLLQKILADGSSDAGLVVFKQQGKVQQYKGIVQFEEVAKDGEHYAKVGILIDFEQGEKLLAMLLIKMDNEWRIQNLNLHEVNQ